MPKDDKVFVKLGFLIHKRTEYEKLRQKTIERNAAKLNSLALRTMAYSLGGTIQRVESKRNKEGKSNMRITDDDGEYQTSDDEERLSSSSEDEEPFRSQTNKMPPGKKFCSQSTRAKSTPEVLMHQPTHPNDLPNLNTVTSNVDDIAAVPSLFGPNAPSPLTQTSGIGRCKRRRIV